MKSLTVREAREALAHLDRLLAEEGELTITRRGEPIARVLPVGQRRPVPSHADLRGSMRSLRRGSEVLVRKDRNDR
jgi:prevent-host-death family protein